MSANFTVPGVDHPEFSSSELSWLYNSSWYATYLCRNITEYFDFDYSAKKLLWRVSTMFTHPAITPPEVYGFAWNLGHSEYIVRSRTWQILGAIHTEARAGDRAEFLFFCPVNNARLCRFSVSQISQNLHTRRGSMSPWILSENIYENLPVRGLFPKRQLLGDHLQRLQAAISPKRLLISESHDRLASLRNVGFPFVPLESTQSHSPGLQAAYKKRHFWTSSALPSSAAA